MKTPDTAWTLLRDAYIFVASVVGSLTILAWLATWIFGIPVDVDALVKGAAIGLTGGFALALWRNRKDTRV